MNLLLDTCALIWMTFDPGRLSTSVAGVLNQPATRLHVSALSAWELGIKVGKGKLGLPEPVSQWFPAVVAEYRLTEISISSHAAAASTELPAIHADAFDRLLVAMAMERHLTIITGDQTIAKYPGVRTLW